MVTRENTTKDEQAYIIATSHYMQEPEIADIMRIIGSDEENAREPVKLLEINSETVEAGIVPVRFPPHPPSGAPYSTIIVEITPEEFDDLKSGKLRLRDDWMIGPSIARPNGEVPRIGIHH